MAWASAAVAAQPPRKFLRVISREMGCSFVKKSVLVFVFFRNPDRFRRIIGGNSRRQENGSSAVDPGGVIGVSRILYLADAVERVSGQRGQARLLLDGRSASIVRFSGSHLRDRLLEHCAGLGTNMARICAAAGTEKGGSLMNTATAVNSATREALEAGEGILRLAPTWVPRVYLQPGRRLKLDQRDLYAYGAHRGGIDERWFGSTTRP